jgi:hypothetical protein
MRCLTRSEIHKWLAGQGMHHQPLDGGVPIAGDYPMPCERRGRLQLAGHLADMLAKDGNKLVEILPSQHQGPQDWECIDRFRQALDEPLRAAQAPGHLFKSGDRMHFRALLALLLGSEAGWSFYIYSAPSHTTLFVGETIDVWTAKKGVRNELARHFMPQRAA